MATQAKRISIDGKITFLPSVGGDGIGMLVEPDDKVPFELIFWPSSVAQVVKGLAMASEAARTERKEPRLPVPAGLQELISTSALGHAGSSVSPDGSQLAIELPLSGNLLLTQLLSIDDAERLANQIAASCRSARQQGSRPH